MLDRILFYALVLVNVRNLVWRYQTRDLLGIQMTAAL